MLGWLCIDILKLFFKHEEGSIGVLGLVGDCLQGVSMRFKGFWDVPVSSESLGAQKTLLGHWGKFLDRLGWSCS